MKRFRPTIPFRVFCAACVLLFSVLACQWGSSSNANQSDSPLNELYDQLAGQKENTPAPTFVSAPAAKPAVLSLQDETLSALYERVNPGVVAIWLITNQGIGQGTGFVVDKEGHIVTNAHVVEGATQVEVNFSSGYKAFGTVIATDLDSDLGVVKVDAPAEQLFPLPLGDSDAIKIGQTVIAIGNPFGLDGTMTTGIVSGKGRTISSLRAAPGGDYFTASDLIQTDAAINPGNSGGPLLNLQGEVIGVNRAIQTSSYNEQGSPVSSGVGFAVAINIVKRVLPSLITTGQYNYPYLGVEALPEITLTAQKQLNLPRADGVYVQRVTNGSPAQLDGVRSGDLILAMDGRQVHNFGELISYLFNVKSPGDPVVLTILRGATQMDLTVKLEKRP